MIKRGLLLILLVCFIPFAYAEIPIGDVGTGERAVLQQEGITYYAIMGDNVIASVRNSEINYYHRDRLGNNVVTSDEGVVSESLTLPFGRELKGPEQRFTFTGKERDVNSGLYYFGARYYDYDTGRFASADPVMDEPSYSYVGNNPLKFVDPTGEARRIEPEPNEAALRGWNIGISAALPAITGIIRGDSFEDIARNVAVGALIGLGSFELKKYVGRHADSDFEMGAARLTENFLSSVRSNAMRNKPLTSELMFDYLFFSARIKYGDVKFGINAARAYDTLTYLSEGDRMDVSATFVTGVPTFSFGATNSLKGETSQYGAGALRYSDSGSHRHEFIHVLQMHSMARVARASFLSFSVGTSRDIGQFELQGLGDISVFLLRNAFEFGYTASGQERPFYTSNWNFWETEAHSLDDH